MIYIIGDVHGCYKTLKALLEKLPKNANVAFVGDVIDRGYGSKDVIELIIKRGYYLVKGNHEEAFCQELPNILTNKKEIRQNKWVNKYGGYETLTSYLKKDGSKKLDEKTLLRHYEFLKKVPLCMEFDIKREDRRLVISHSSVGEKWIFRDAHEGSRNYYEFKEYLLKNRDKDVIDNIDIYNVFGHTPNEKAIIKTHYANVDTGCVYKGKGKNLDTLSALEFPTLKIITQKNIENKFLGNYNNYSLTFIITSTLFDIIS